MKIIHELSNNLVKITLTNQLQLLLNELIIEEIIGLFTVRDVHDGLTLLPSLFLLHYRCYVGETGYDDQWRPCEGRAVATANLVRSGETIVDSGGYVSDTEY